VKSPARIAVVASVALACAVALGAASLPARASAAPGPKASQTIENIHSIQVAVDTYAQEHNNHYPRYTTNRRFRALLENYLDVWPTNPWSHHSMRQKRNRGNFTYRRIGDSYRLIGWGPHDRRIIVVP